MKCFPLPNEKDNTYSIPGDPLRLLDHESPGGQFRQGRKVVRSETQYTSRTSNAIGLPIRAKYPPIRLYTLITQDNLLCHRYPESDSKDYFVIEMLKNLTSGIWLLYLCKVKISSYDKN